MSEKKGVPKRDGSGNGQRLNKGRGGCVQPRKGTRSGQCGGRGGRGNRGGGRRK